MAAFGTWHEAHVAAVRALGSEPGIVAHAGAETYSVLTRLPPPHRAPPEIVAGFLEQRFGRRWIGLSPSQHRSLLARLPELGIAGGSTYDALIAAAALRADATLVTCDERALRVYAAIGVDVDLVGERPVSP